MGNIRHVIVLLAVSLLISIQTNGQDLVCNNYIKLQSDSSTLAGMSYPYPRVKYVDNHSDNQSSLLIYYQGFYEHLLVDIDTMIFEWVNLEKTKSQIIKIPIDSIFNEHNVEPRYMLNDFSLIENKLYLLVYDKLYVFEISRRDVVFVEKINLKKGFYWLTMVDQNHGIFMDYVGPNGEKNLITAYNINLRTLTSKKMSISFRGTPYLKTESSFFSETSEKIFIGYATSPTVFVLNKKAFTLDDSIRHSKVEDSHVVDTVQFRDKMQFFKDLQTLDSNKFHYQTCYANDSFVFRGKTRSAFRTEHYLDIYKKNELHWDSVTTLFDGPYNLRKFKDSSLKYSSTSFDPLSGTRAIILIGDVLYHVALEFEMSDNGSSIKFTKNSLLGLEGYSYLRSKNFKLCLYSYKLKYH